MFRQIEIDRFWSRVNKIETCWLWTGSLTSSGYGCFHVGACEVDAHLFSWELHYGPTIGDNYVLHTCDNKLCVNPEHLYLGTQVDNMLDMKLRGRSKYSNHAAKLTKEQVLEIRGAKNTYAELASKYNVNKTTIRDVRLKRYYKYV